MPRPFVVEGKACPRGLGVMTDLDESALMPQPGAHAAGRRRRRAVQQRGPPRMAGQQMQCIGEQQLLMLLLVMETEFQRGRDRGPALVVAARDQLADVQVDVLPVGADLIERRPRQQAPLRSRMARAEAFVIRVEEVVVAVVERLVARQVRAQQQGLEEPARVGLVPFGGTGVLHRLGGLVLGGQRLRQRQRVTPHRLVTAREVAPRGRQIVIRHASNSCRPGGGWAERQR